MAIKAEALVIVIDVSPSMNDVIDESGQTALQKCITAANMILQRKIFTDTKKHKDEAALILFGTEGANNPLHDQFGEGNYENITISRDLSVIDVEMLKFVNNDIVAGSTGGDFVDALVVALDHLNTKCSGRKMDQKVVLFSTLQHEFNADQIQTIIGGMKANNVNLIFVGPENPDDGDGDSDEESGDQQQQQPQQLNRKPLTEQQMTGVRCIDHVLEEVDGDGISIDDVLPMLSFFELRRKKQVTTFRGTIDIGSNLKINVYAYTKVKEERPASWKKLSALAEHAANRDTMGVDMQRTYHLNDTDRTEVEKDNVAQAYRYGKTIVPMTSDDQKSMKMQTTKSCKVLGFTSKENVPRALYTRDVCHILTPQPGDEHAAVAFSSLCHALQEKDMVAIVRYVSRGNTDPKLGFLAPHIKSSYEGLIFIALPFREDMRSYVFPPLNQKKVTEQHDAAVDNLIDDMKLVENIDIKKDEDSKNNEEQYKPKELLNPVNQRQCQCIQSRALNDNQDELPDIEAYITRMVRVKPETVTRCEASLNNLKNLFPLKEVEQKKNDVFKDVGNDEKKDEEKSADSASQQKEEFALNDVAGKEQVKKISVTDPVDDFKNLIENASNEDERAEACRQICAIIMRLVTESFLDQHYQKALSCIRALKEYCIKIETPKAFNELYEDLKSTCVGKRRQDFWDFLATNNVDAIHDPKSVDISNANSDKQPMEVEEEETSVDKESEDADALLDLL